jgi:hypothetical protein
LLIFLVEKQASGSAVAKLTYRVDEVSGPSASLSFTQRTRLNSNTRA